MSDNNKHQDDGLAPDDWLGAWQVPAAKSEFRDRLRAAFVQGELAAPLGGLAEAEHTLDEHDTSGDDFRIAELQAEVGPLLDRLEVPAAPAGVREELRAAFVSGESSEAGRPQIAPQPARRLSTRLRLVAASVAAAAAVWLLLLRPTGALAPVESLQVVPGSYTTLAGLTADGVDLVDLELEEINDRLAKATTITTAESAVRVQLGDYWVVEMGPNAELEWLERDLIEGSSDIPEGARKFVMQSEQGSLRFATGPAFDGSEMLVKAPYLDAEVVGTVFAVDIYDQFSCLCCYEGTVEVQPSVQQDAVFVEGGETSFAGETYCKRSASPNAHTLPLESLATFWQ